MADEDKESAIKSVVDSQSLGSSEAPNNAAQPSLQQPARAMQPVSLKRCFGKSRCRLQLSSPAASACSSSPSSHSGSLLHSPGCSAANTPSMAAATPSIHLKRSCSSLLVRHQSSTPKASASSAIETGLVLYQAELHEQYRTTATPSSEVADIDDVALKLARLRSPSKPLMQRSSSTPAVLQSSNGIRSVSEGKVQLQNSQRFVGRGELLELKQAQRGPQGWYKADLFFPTLVKSRNPRVCGERIFDTTSCKLATKFVCHGISNCTRGDCLVNLDGLDVYKARSHFSTAAASSSLRTVLYETLLPFYDRGHQRWDDVPVPLDEHTTIRCCPCSFCLFAGISPSVGYSLVSDIANGIKPDVKVATFLSFQAKREMTSLDFAMLRQYIAELINQHEADPAPGAHQPGRQTYMTKQTWKQKWEFCCAYFKNAARVPGSQSMLKRA